ncbi:MAG: tryptophan-rich sensory protein [Candidatus Bathyarchaeota archaeon]|nr:tryptophan-rich sensory protein [Candidatus Bathyarchaeota archaeon]
MSTKKTSAVALQVGNILAFIATLIVNGLVSTTTILGGRTTAEVSDQYFTLITPAGYVFSIWSIIYILLGVFVVYQALPSQRGKPFQRQISGLFILSSIFNIGWIFLWQYNYISVSVVLMMALFATLIAIYLRLEIGKSDAPLREKLALHLPFSVYFGWITVAAAANVAAALSYAGWIQWTPDDAVWGIVAAAVVLAVALTVIATRRDIAYGLVIIWALIGIAVNQSAVPEIVYTAEIGAAVIAVVLVVSVIVGRRKNSKYR